MGKSGIWGILCPMKKQMANRLGVAHVRDTMMQFVTGAITREQAMESLRIGKTRLYDLSTLCKTECANGTKAWCCLHLDGTVSLVMNKPEKERGPQIVFANNPKVRAP